MVLASFAPAASAPLPASDASTALLESAASLVPLASTGPLASDALPASPAVLASPAELASTGLPASAASTALAASAASTVLPASASVTGPAASCGSRASAASPESTAPASSSLGASISPSVSAIVVSPVASPPPLLLLEEDSGVFASAPPFRSESPPVSQSNEHTEYWSSPCSPAQAATTLASIVVERGRGGGVRLLRRHYTPGGDGRRRPRSSCLAPVDDVDHTGPHA